MIVIRIKIKISAGVNICCRANCDCAGGIASDRVAGVVVKVILATVKVA